MSLKVCEEKFDVLSCSFSNMIVQMHCTDLEFGVLKQEGSFGEFRLKHLDFQLVLPFSFSVLLDPCK